MTHSTKDIKRSLVNSSFLFIGDGGSGKTRLAGTFPKPYFFDFDKGMASLAGADGIEYDTFKDAPAGATVITGQGIYPYGTAWGEFKKRVDEIGETIDKGTCQYETLVLDSLTMLSDLCMNAILKANGRPGGAIEIQHWGRQIEQMKTLLDQITAWPLIKVATAHIQRDTNDLLKTVEMLPLLTGKLAAKAPIYFDEVYYTDVERPKGKPALFFVTTQSTAIIKAARSRFEVPDRTESTWAAISKAVKA